MWSTPSSSARRSTARAASGSRGGPKTPGPASCIAPKPMRLTVWEPSVAVWFMGMHKGCGTLERHTRGASIVGLAPPPSEARRAELAGFLRQRPAQVSPERFGIEPNGRLRTPGLRREEVAQLAVVGLSGDTGLGHGRRIKPSPPAPDAPARL